MLDVAIIGCGVVGAAAAYELSQYPLHVAVLEAENDVADGTTKANSAILHAGYDPEPGTQMARLNVQGVALAKEICARLDVPYRQCGSLVLALSQAELPHLQKLYANGVANGVPGIRLLTAEENVCYPLRLQKMDKEKALELARQRLTDMGIRESYFRKLPNQLSGGEQQRVAIARALAAGSRVILADEPTGSLDSDNGRMIVETLQRLAHQEERCVIVVTHDPKVAEAADIRLHMQDGKLSGEEA